MKNFLKHMWEEIEPILAHCASVVLLEVTILVVAIVTLGLEFLIPNQQTLLHRIEAIEAQLAEGVLWLFGTFMFIRLVIRMLKIIWKELKGFGNY